MKAFYFDPEHYETAIDNATTRIAAQLARGVLDRDVATTRTIVDCVNDALADEQAMADLVRNTVAGMPSMGRLVADVIQAEAERLAVEQVEQQARQQYEACAEQLYDAMLEHAA